VVLDSEQNNSREGIVQYQVGMWVRNVKLPEWGIGEVVETDGDKVRVVFAVVGEKNLNVRFATLEEMPCPAEASSSRFKINVKQSVDVAEVECLCRKFHDEFKDRTQTRYPNRRNESWSTY
jgi:hypothetical protein